MACWFTCNWIYGLLVYSLLDLWPAGLLVIGFMACWFTRFWIYGLLVYSLLDLWPAGLLVIGFYGLILLDLLTASSCWAFKKKLVGYIIH